MSDEVMVATIESPVVEAPKKDEPAKEAAPQVDAVVVSDPAPEKAEADPLETEARGSGWKPLAEYSGDPRKWVEARVWVENKPLVDQVRASKERERKQQKTITALQQHYKVVHEAAYRKALEDLQAQKDAAVLEQDVDKVRAVDAEIAATRVQQIKTAPVVENTVDPAYLQWVATETGKKINADAAMWEEATAYAETWERRGLDPEQVIERVESHIKRTFPDKFTNPRRQAPAMVEGVGASVPTNGGNGGGKRFTVNDLNKEEREVMAYIVDGKTITQEQYLKDIAATRGGQKYFTIGD